MPEPIQTPSAVPPAAPAPAAPVVQAAPAPAAPAPPAPAPTAPPAAAAAPAAVTAPAAPEPPVAAAAPTTPATPTVAPTAAELAPDDSDDHESRVVTMRRADLGKMVRDQKDAALLKEAKALGFETTAALLDAAKKARAATPEPPAPAPPPAVTTPPAVPTPPAPQAAAALPPATPAADDIERERKARIAAERKVARLASERDADRAEFALRNIAAEAGIEDTDYAVRLYTRACEGKSADDLAKMNEGSFFKDLLTKKPYLARAESRPATTGPGAAGAPASAPSPGTVAAAAGAAAVFDARKATQAQIDARLAQLKIDTHERGVVGTPQKEE